MKPRMWCLQHLVYYIKLLWKREKCFKTFSNDGYDVWGERTEPKRRVASWKTHWTLSSPSAHAPQTMFIFSADASNVRFHGRRVRERTLNGWWTISSVCDSQKRWKFVIMDARRWRCIWSSLTAECEWARNLRWFNYSENAVQQRKSELDSPESVVTAVTLRLLNCFQYVLIDFHLMWFDEHLQARFPRELRNENCNKTEKMFPLAFGANKLEGEINEEIFCVCQNSFLHLTSLLLIFTSSLCETMN